MFGQRRIISFIVRATGERRTRAVIVGATVGAVVFAASAGYTVVAGDTLSELAKDNGTSISKLVELNGIADPDLILTGEVLTIPGSESQSHLVRTGETLGEIAIQYGVSVTALAETNGLTNVNLVRIGQKLAIPVGGGSEQGGGGASRVVHIVKTGDTLAEIAARYGTTVAAIMELNDIEKPSLIYAGTPLTVDGPKQSTNGGDASSATKDEPSQAATETTHTVKAGETLGDIAGKYGVSANAIAKLNNLDNPNRIRVGQKLRIPEGSTQTPEANGPSFLCPVPNSTFLDDYGYVKPDGRFHQGIDMMATRGSPVYAPVSGRVDAISGTLGGLQFWLYGDDGNLYIGTHLSDFGEMGRVSQGAVIGGVGDSGNAIGGPTHVHFEILVDGTSTNPYPTLKKACG